MTPLVDVVRWRCRTRLEKYAEDGGLVEVVTRDGNLLMYGGASALWHRLIGGTAVVAYSEANAHIGVGDGSAATAATQTDLQGATKFRKPMAAGYPSHADGTTAGAQQLVFRSVFGPTEANFTWAEWAIFNASAAGRMLNRKVEALGTKAAGATWTYTVTLSLA